MSPADYVQTHLENHVAYLTLSQPEKRNPLSLEMLKVLRAALREMFESPEVRALVICSTGPVFCAGHDLQEMRPQQNEAREVQARRITEILETCSGLMMDIVYGPKAVIASVQGMATAAGCQLVSACDLAIASEAAKFCTPGVNIGGFCTTPLVGIGRNLSRKHAMELALLGEPVDADYALQFGLLNRVVPHDALVEETRSLAEKIASKSAQGIRAGKADFYRQIDMPLAEAFEFANEAMVAAMMTPDSDEGIRAFFEKRQPNWQEA